ncbi:hypothetical protein D9V80_01215 [Buchnera aphidicola (Thelaxes californica)]|uniref:TACO1/YebC-like N-terminal domain-containing protein n=1 Tax=Buchnera aphidicola (Thelaxes californica) TaxID=1315998 RepID=A0A4D6YM43_9GAMM|nr:YebC/PmpR family DNA-binding transcriptional regulator [Buchnera aphidicola]QCI26778.1 hypothetical protein D9V80_01215 [Buchnera aphidicola (Thelaxes californica)]
MAGHSKWSNTKHRKHAQDVKKSKVFMKLTRELTTSVKLGGKNPTYNAHLRTTINKALNYNMPKITIQKIIDRCIE